MIGVVILSMRIRVNPDNITTPIAASLGDMTTLICMVRLFSGLKLKKKIFHPAKEALQIGAFAKK